MQRELVRIWGRQDLQACDARFFILVHVAVRTIPAVIEPCPAEVTRHWASASAMGIIMIIYNSAMSLMACLHIIPDSIQLTRPRRKLDVLEHASVL